MVGTPWFITQTDSVGCLLRCCRWVSKKHIKTQNDNNKRKLLHKLCHDGGGDECCDGGARRAVRDGATAVSGEGGRAGGLEERGVGGAKRECDPLGRHGNQPVDHVVPHAQPRHQTNYAAYVCKGPFFLELGVGLGRNMPSHAAFAEVDVGTPRPPSRLPASLAVMLVVALFFFESCLRQVTPGPAPPLRPAPPPPPSPSLSKGTSFDVRNSQTRRPNSSTGKNESKRSLCTKFISCKDFDIYMSSLSLFFVCFFFA